MAALYVLGLLLVFGCVQSNPLNGDSQLGFIEDIRNAESRIVGGWPALDAKQIPYQVSLRMVNTIGSVSSCGGSVIHHEWILTAAHCLANRITFVVRLGLTNVTKPGYIVETDKKVIHPDYDEIRAGVQTADIALLGLDHHIPYSDTIQPCRLQNTAMKNFNYDGIQFIVSGYGRTDDLWNGGTASEILRWVYLKGITNEECLRWYPNSAAIAEQTVCATSYNESSQSSCQGDSGGPLTMVDYDGKPTMVGVVSFGSTAGCNSPFPGGYVRPGHYQYWFREVTGIDFDWTENTDEDEDVGGDENGDSYEDEDAKNAASFLEDQPEAQFDNVMVDDMQM